MPKEWNIDIAQYGQVRISPLLVNKISKFRQISFGQPESGGVLIGKHLNTGGALLIDDFTPPQHSDKQGRCLYYRSEVHNTIVQKIWQDSGGHSTYVGLWHTHPEPIPNFSHVDKTDWLDALKRSRFEGDRLYFIIIGQTHIRCWIGTKCKFRCKIELSGEYEIG